jgi:hypothetical protein
VQDLARLVDHGRAKLSHGGLLVTRLGGSPEVHWGGMLANIVILATVAGSVPFIL